MEKRCAEFSPITGHYLSSTMPNLPSTQPGFYYPIMELPPCLLPPATGR